MATYTIAPSRKPYQHRTPPVAYDKGFFALEEVNIEQAVFPVSGGISIPLTASIEITLAKDQVRPFDVGYIELVQDHIGGWIPTWANATGTNGGVPVPAAGASMPTLYQGVYVHDTWVLTLLASNYGNATVNAALALAFDRLDSAMLPLPRTQTVVDGYVAAFA